MRDGSSIDSWWCLRSLCWNGYRVDLIAFAPRGSREGSVAAAEPGLDRIRFIPREVRRQAPVTLLRSLALGASYLGRKYRDRGYAEAVDEFLRTRQYDAVVIDRAYPGVYLDTIRRRVGAPPVILRAHNVERDLLDTEARRRSGPLRPLLRREARLFGDLEAGLVASVDRVFAITPKDAARLAELGGRPVEVLPAFLDPGEGSDGLLPGDGGTIVCTGDFTWRPNARGVMWFLREVWPSVRSWVPGSRLLIAGREATRFARAAAGPRVTLLAEVGDMRQVLRRAHVVISPVFDGSGVRMKVLEALAAGRRVLATPTGAAGIDYAGVRIEDSSANWRVALADELRRPPTIDNDGVTYVTQVHSWRRIWSPTGQVGGGA